MGNLVNLVIWVEIEDNKKVKEAVDCKDEVQVREHLSYIQNGINQEIVDLVSVSIRVENGSLDDGNVLQNLEDYSLNFEEDIIKKVVKVD